MPEQTISTPSTQAVVTDEQKLLLAKAAINHTLNAVCDDPRKYWLVGGLTGTWEKLTAAHAALFGMDVAKVRSSFVPRTGAYKEFCAQKERDDALLEYCRDYGITLEWLQENRIRGKAD